MVVLIRVREPRVHILAHLIDILLRLDAQHEAAVADHVRLHRGSVAALRASQGFLVNDRVHIVKVEERLRGAVLHRGDAVRHRLVYQACSVLPLTVLNRGLDLIHYTLLLLDGQKVVL